MPPSVSTPSTSKMNAFSFKIYDQLPVGYYEINLEIGGNKYKSVLAVAPTTCYENPVIRNSKVWGYALQLYSLRSNRNWGVGDFTDLGEFIKIWNSK